MQPETALAIATMISGFGASSIDVDAQLEAYRVACEDCREDAIKTVCKRFLRGEVAGHKAHRLPTAAEFAQECRSEHAAVTARENRGKLLPRPEERGNTHTPEHRERMLNLLGLLSRACRGDRAAQKALRPWGWRSDDDEHKEAAE